MQHRFAWLAFAGASALALVLSAACGQGTGSFSPEDAGAPDASGPRHHDAKAPPVMEAAADTHVPEDSDVPVLKSGGGPYTDFPMPVYEGMAPHTSGTLFGPGGSGAKSGGPCIVEPEADVLYPQNWLRPRFTWSPVSGENLFELRLRVANQTNDLVVYTTLTQWTMPLAMWNALRTHSANQPMRLTVTGGAYDGKKLGGEARGSSYLLRIAPVEATGVMVYWTSSGGTSLKGFSIGDETVAEVLTPAEVTETKTSCIGCHTATPGGEYVGFSLQNSAGWPNALANISADAGPVGGPPGFLGAGGAAALARADLGISAFSPAHWSAGDHRMIVAFNDPAAATQTSVLQWIDLEAKTLGKATGTLARTGDPSFAGAPAWSHDGKTVAYVSTPMFCTGRLGGGCEGTTLGHTDPGSTADIYTIPYASGAGGKATPLPGASSASVQEYYPVFSPDDAWLAFDSIPNGLNMYNQSSAEVSVVPAGGGVPTRLKANDPAACSGITSPGVTNSWPKWGPTALKSGGSTYYWLVFSSTRASGGVPQLYVTGVVQTGGTIETHGALYLWNQPSTENNHTPAWDTFQVPPIPPPK